IAPGPFHGEANVGLPHGGEPFVGVVDGSSTTAIDGDSAFQLLVDTVGDILRAQNDERDPFFVAVQVHTWIHGIVDLQGSRPSIPWPDTEALLDGLRMALDLEPR
ncbi:MAG: hypothetical protein AAFY28_22485, partial [Actinomycetota bacterium]